MQGEPYPDDPYEVLGVSRQATEGQIRRAYHRAVRAWHPDLHPDVGEEGLRRLQRARWAYDTLRDPR
ncbi:MAG: J domain-containing protein, partial [Deltaproteobacteria bacterium]